MKESRLPELGDGGMKEMELFPPKLCGRNRCMVRDWGDWKGDEGEWGVLDFGGDG